MADSNSTQVHGIQPLRGIDLSRESQIPTPQQHWQDFDQPATFHAAQAGNMYRAVLGIRQTLQLIADHHTRVNSHGAVEPRLSAVELEAMLSGALVLADTLNGAFEEEHFRGADA
jgi:hypothetical protein